MTESSITTGGMSYSGNKPLIPDGVIPDPRYRAMSTDYRPKQIMRKSSNF